MLSNHQDIHWELSIRIINMKSSKSEIHLGVTVMHWTVDCVQVIIENK